MRTARGSLRGVRGWAAAASLLAVAAVTATASAHDTTGLSTLQQTIDGNDPSSKFRFLRLDPGEDRLVREDLARAQPGRSDRRRSLAYFGHITDFQLSDEESPARVEFLDRNAASEDFKSAHRPQEALVPHQVEFTVRQLNRFFRSPVRQGSGKRAAMVNAVMTGDLADNQHKNETEQVVRLLEGGVLDPSSGSIDDADYNGELGCPPPGPLRDPLKAEAPNYTGVQDYDDYPLDTRDTDFYDPDEPDGEYATKDFPTYEGLLDKAQQPFTARGLKVPSYVAFGNHDGLAQGNEDAIAPFERIATGCRKVFPAPTLPPGPGGGSLVDFLSDPSALLDAEAVPPDPDRQYVDKRQFKRLHDTGEQRDEHGFALVDQDELRASRGAASYYSFVPDTRSSTVRYIVLDTLSEGGVVGVSSSGNVDDPQWQWLRGELRKAERRNELVVAFAHHATTSLNANAPDEAATRCSVRDEHGHDVNPGCDRDPRSSTPLHFGDDLVRLFHRFPSVIALVAGHSHENEIEPYRDADGSGDFWEIKSPAIIDWPPQHRVIEVMDNRDGTLSIFGTILDHDGPSLSPGSLDADGVGDLTPAELASIGRTLSYNDPQVGPGPPEGTRRDRNVELLIGDPRVQNKPPGGGGNGPGGDPDPNPAPDRPDGGGGTDSGDSGGQGTTGAAQEQVRTSLGGTAGAGAGGDLPFTGLALAVLALLGVALVVAGRTLRRGASD